VRYAVAGRDLVDRVMGENANVLVPGGADPTLAGHGLVMPVDPSEGAYPSGLSQVASAALTLYELTGRREYRDVARHAVEPVRELALARSISMGGTLSVLADLRVPGRELVVVTDDRTDALASLAARAEGLSLIAVVSGAQAEEWAAEGFELFANRSLRGGHAAAYLCEDLVCRLPVADPIELASLLHAHP
jgi:uncharacterized protein YyaL (SSP411 family)